MALTNSGAAFYKFIDQKVGGTSGANTQMGQVGPWQNNTVYVAGQVVRNGGFYFRCTAGGTSLVALNAAPQASGPTPTVLADNGVTWVLVGPAGSGLYASDAAAAQEIGYEAVGLDQDKGLGVAWFRYVKFSGVVNPGDWVIIDQADGTCVQSPAAAPGANKTSIIGISMGTQGVGTFGWVMIKGTHDEANVAAAGVVGTILAGSGVAGRATSAAQTATYIFDGTAHRVAGVAGAGCVEISWPTCSGR